MRLGTPGFCGERLRQARTARGLSAIELASKLGVSRQSVSQYELDEQSPSPGVFCEILAILGLPGEYFTWSAPVAEMSGEVWFRTLKSTTRRSREAAEARFGWLLDIVAELERHVPLPQVSLPQVDVGDPS